MSSLSLCDGADCYQTENDCDVYHIDNETEKFLREHCRHWMNGSYYHICQDCIDSTNNDYPEFFMIDEMNDLYINDKYLDNPELLK